jgi:outer membrane protein
VRPRELGPLALVAVLSGARAAGAGETFTLDEALARALAHPRLGEARAEGALAAARVDEARAGWLPSAGVTLSYWRATASSTLQPGQSLPDLSPMSGLTFRPSYSFYGAVAGVSQTLWDFGRTENQVRAAEAAVRSARQDGRVVAADVELGVRLAYYEALAAAELLRSAEQTVANLDRHLAAATALVRAGKRPPFDVTRARIDLANARVARLAASSAVVESRLALAAAIGVDELPDAPLAAPAARPGTDPPVPEVLARSVRRPEMASLDARIAAARALLDAQRSNHYPVLSASGQLSVGAVERPVLESTNNWQLGVQLVAPLLRGGADQAQVRQQEAALDRLMATRAALVLQIRVEAQQLVDAVAGARARQEAAAAIIVEAREGLTIAEQRYQAGVAPLIELADGQRTLSAAEAQATRAAYDLAVARARRQRATGPPPSGTP